MLVIGSRKSDSIHITQKENNHTPERGVKKPHYRMYIRLCSPNLKAKQRNGEITFNKGRLFYT